MSEQTDATEDRPDDDSAPEKAPEDENEGPEQPQPWAKTSSGDAD